MKVNEEFDKRVSEINVYFEILFAVECEKPKLTAYDINQGDPIEVTFNSQKIQILRANAFLLMYNLIESTIYNSILTIFDSITDNNIKYADMIAEVQRYWLNNLYKHDEKKRKDTIIDSFMGIANQILNNTITLASNEISYGGSLDARTIFETAKSMKIKTANVERIYDKNVHGNNLREVKQNRNWLAHGEKSFSEVGKDVSYESLDTSKTNIISFLEEFIKSVEDYIHNEEYRVKVVPD